MNAAVSLITDQASAVAAVALACLLIAVGLKSFQWLAAFMGRGSGVSRSREDAIFAAESAKYGNVSDSFEPLPLDQSDPDYRPSLWAADEAHEAALNEAEAASSGFVSDAQRKHFFANLGDGADAGSTDEAKAISDKEDRKAGDMQALGMSTAQMDAIENDYAAMWDESPDFHRNPGFKNPMPR